MKTTIKNIDGTEVISQDVIINLRYNNTYCPDVKQVIYNVKTEEKVTVLDDKGLPEKEIVLDKTTGKPVLDKFGNPVSKNKVEWKKLANPKLATTVYFTDDTKVTVQNSEHDKVIVKEVCLDTNGNVLKDLSDKSKIAKTIYVADDCSKEAGLCYAIVRRMCGKPDSKTNEVSGNGLAKLLKNLISTAYDQNLETAKAKLQKAASKAKAEAARKQPKTPKAKHYSYNDVAQLLGKVLEGLATKLDLDPEDLAKAATEVVDAEA